MAASFRDILGQLFPELNAAQLQQCDASFRTKVANLIASASSTEQSTTAPDLFRNQSASASTSSSASSATTPASHTQKNEPT